VARWFGKPVFHEINGKPADFAVTYPGLVALAPLVTWLYRRQFTRASHLFPVTDGIKDWAMSFAGHVRVSVIPNAADTRLFTPQGPVAEGHGRYVLFVGGLVAWHGIGTMLAALDHPDWPHDVRLVVAGDGVERGKLEARHLHPRLTWLGRRPQAEVPPLLRGALGALCVISDPEGRSGTGVAPLKLFEAMATGVPVIVSDLPFQADLVRDQAAGLVVPPDDPGALARAVATLVAAPDAARAMGQRGASYAVEHASWRQRAEAIGLIMAVELDG
jgi:glycosyltransferase involved in cell wall biosynthesis